MEEKDFCPCEDCWDIDGCTEREACRKEEVITEDVAKIREENDELR